MSAHDSFANAEAERCVLGAAIIDERAARKACALPEQAFAVPQNRIIFSAIKALETARKPIDLMTVDAELTQRGALEDAGGIGYIIEISQYVPTTANVGAYIDLVQEAAMKREIRAACVETINKLGECTSTDALDTHSLRMQSLLTSAEDDSITTRDAIMHFVDSLGERSKPDTLKRMYTGIPALDAKTGGLFGGKLVVVGARPGIGKSAFALTCALATCAHSRQRVLYVSLEMDEVELMTRIVARYSGVPVDAIERGQLSTEQHIRIVEPFSLIDGYKIDFNTRADTPAKIRHAAYKAHERGDLALIIVDYISLMRSGERAESKRVEVGQITRALKRLAQELKVPVLALSQLNRQSEGGINNAGQRIARQPTMAELRESGDVEQDANVVLLLHRPENSDSTEEERRIAACKSRGNAYTVLLLEKNRQGQRGVFPVEFDGAHMNYLRIMEDAV